MIIRKFDNSTYLINGNFGYVFVEISGI